MRKKTIYQKELANEQKNILRAKADSRAMKRGMPQTAKWHMEHRPYETGGRG